MRKLIFTAFIILSSCLSAHAAITIVDNDSNHGHIKCGSGAASCVTSTGIDTTGATLYVAVIATYTVPITRIWSIIGDNTNNGTSFDVWTCLPAYHTTGGSYGTYSQICYAQNPTPSPYVYFGLITSGGNPTLLVSIWKGAKIASVLDVSSGAGSTGNVTSQSTGSTGTLSTTGELLISGLSSYGAALTLSVNSGLTIQDSNLSGSVIYGASAYLVSSSTAAVNATWSTSGSAAGLATSIAAFIPETATPIHVYDFTSGVTQATGGGGPYASIISNPVTEITGNLMVCGVSAWINGTTSLYPTSVSDANNSYVDTGVHLDIPNGSGLADIKMSIWYAKNVTGGTAMTPTAAWGAGTYSGYVICHQYANMNTIAPLDTTASGTDLVAGTSVTSGALTTTFANDVIFSFSTCILGGVQTFTPGTNFTLRGLDYTALQAGPGAPTTPYSDIWQAAAVQDWTPNSIETGVTPSISYNNASNSGMIVAAFKGLGGTPVRLRGSVAQ